MLCSNAEMATSPLFQEDTSVISSASLRSLDPGNPQQPGSQSQRATEDTERVVARHPSQNSSPSYTHLMQVRSHAHGFHNCGCGIEKCSGGRNIGLLAATRRYNRP